VGSTQLLRHLSSLDLSADLVIVTDSGTPLAHLPALTERTRGMVVGHASWTRAEDMLHSLASFFSTDLEVSASLSCLSDMSTLSTTLLEQLPVCKEYPFPVKTLEQKKLYAQRRWFSPAFDPLYVHFQKQSSKKYFYSFTFSGPASELHSGVFGGAVISPIKPLIRFLVGLEPSIDIVQVSYGDENQRSAIFPTAQAIIASDTELSLRFFSSCSSVQHIAKPSFENSAPVSYLSVRTVPEQDPRAVATVLRHGVNATGGKFILHHASAAFSICCFYL